MSRDDIIQNVKDAKFQIEFMALMLLSDRQDKAAAAYECAPVSYTHLRAHET